MLSAISLYFFLLFIMFHPFESIDTFLEVMQHKKHTSLLSHEDCSFQICLLTILFHKVSAFEYQ